MGHVAHMIQSCRTYEWAMSHIWMNHVSHMKELCRTYVWVMSHVWMSRFSYIYNNTSPHLLCDVAHIKKSRRTYGWAFSHKWMRFVPYSYWTWLIQSLLWVFWCIYAATLVMQVTHCNMSLQHDTATWHCNMLQHTLFILDEWVSLHIWIRIHPTTCCVLWGGFD